VALRFKVLADAPEQLVDPAHLGKILAEQPDGRRIRHRVLKTQVEKAHEGQAIADHKLCLLVGQIV
jgi:hypothetical protein